MNLNLSPEAFAANRGREAAEKFHTGEWDDIHLGMRHVILARKGEHVVQAFWAAFDERLETLTDTAK